LIALLDVKVLVVLFDPAHVHHEAAHATISIRSVEDAGALNLELIAG
jgi:hypothetical protein